MPPDAPLTLEQIRALATESDDAFDAAAFRLFRSTARYALDRLAHVEQENEKHVRERKQAAEAWTRDLQDLRHLEQRIETELEPELAALSVERDRLRAALEKVRCDTCGYGLLAPRSDGQECPVCWQARDALMAVPAAQRQE
jgi:rubrerythrin